MEFTFEDAEELYSLVSSEEALVDKKRRLLESMILKLDGCSSPLKRPKFLNETYLPESFIRSGEISCQKVRASIGKSLSSECNGYTHHVVQDGLWIFDFQKKENEPLGPEYLGIMQCTISKLTDETLQSVACIVSRNEFNFDKTRMAMEEIVRSHLPSYLANLDHKDTICQLFNIFRNPCSYRSGSVRLVTPVAPQLLSAIHHVLDRLDEMPTQTLIAMNRKIEGKSSTPKFGSVPRCSTRGHIIEMVRRRCNKVLTELKEGNYLPKNLAKAMSVANLCQKQKLRSVDISQSEFFPFAKETISLQNDILNALWSLRKRKHRKLKLLQPMLDHDSKAERKELKPALRIYLTECLFECDEGGLPDEALQAIAFINRNSRRQQVVLTEERKEVEVDDVLNLSSNLQASAHCCLEECSCGEELFSLGNDSCNEDNDFILSGTNYLNLNSEQQQTQEPCCSTSSNIGTDVMRECWSETFGDTNNVSEAGDSGSKSEEILRKSCPSTEDSGGVAHCSGSEAVDSGVEPLCSPHDDGNGPANSAENLEGDIFIHAVEPLLPNLPKGCIDKVKRLMS